MLIVAAASTVDGPGHEVPADEVEGRLPAVDHEPVAAPQGLEVVVVPDRVVVVLGDVFDEIDPATGRAE